MVDASLAAQIRDEAFRFGLSLDSYLREAMLGFRQHFAFARNQEAYKEPPRPRASPQLPPLSVAAFNVARHAHGQSTLSEADPVVASAADQIYRLAEAHAPGTGATPLELFMTWTDVFLSDLSLEGHPTEMLGRMHRYTSIVPAPSASWTVEEIWAKYLKIRPTA